MDQLFRFPNSVERDPAVDAWLDAQASELKTIARFWLEIIRETGDDVRELMHDGHPTACVGDAAFAYIDVFKAHVNVGFFRGAELADPAQLLEGTGKSMRHIKLRPEDDINTKALIKLIETAYQDMEERVKRSST